MVLLLAGCTGTTSGGSTPGTDAGPGTDTGPQPDSGPIVTPDAGGSSGLTPRDSVSMYVFGHSLAAWSEPNTSVGQHMCWVAEAAGRPCCGDGQWPMGFEPSVFSNFAFPPQPIQGQGPSCWEGSFASTGFDVITITEANFYFETNDPTAIPPREALGLIERIRGDHPGVPIYLYEHWPPIETFTFDQWKSRNHRDFHEWFVAIQDEVNRRDPGANLKLLPVGWIFARLLEQVPAMRTLRQSDLFVDPDPHGTATTYFLAGLIHYMALYRERAPASLTAPDYVHPTVRDNLPAIVDFVWRDLQAVTDASGASRVF